MVSARLLPYGLQFHCVSNRMMSEHRIFPITPSRWQYQKMKDLFHFYLFVGAIPVGLIVLFTNIFIGPATLTEIPEGYTPKHWEYYRHPITRFIVRYIYPSHQQEYEKYLHVLYEEDELRKINLLTKKVKGMMMDRADYQAFYYVPYTKANYARAMKEKGDETAERYGVN
ncbi:NADH dehydrogenase (ubiquinone) SGDH subunit isoform X2 [Lycorma delicatula]|uniref:NADH dehydrogenase (ubiquinone) SGDH subunit isoform X2 n=1 Tax=Lycorma delicatula TaxID=130591 RepID=UPI003F51906F